MDKSLGYVVPFDLWNGDVKKDTVYVRVPGDDRNYGVIDCIEKDNFYMPSEIVESWEPFMLKESFNENEWVSFCGGQKFLKEGEAYKIHTVDIDHLIFKREDSMSFGPKDIDHFDNLPSIFSVPKIFAKKIDISEVKNLGKLIFEKGEVLLCTNSISTGASSHEFIQGKKYLCFNRSSIINEYGNIHGISQEFASHHFRHTVSYESNDLLNDVMYFTFGSVEVVARKTLHQAISLSGTFSHYEIKNVIDYIKNPPQLQGHSLNIYNKMTGTGYRLNQLDSSDVIRIGIGCKMGTFEELESIYNYIK